MVAVEILVLEAWHLLEKRGGRGGGYQAEFDWPDACGRIVATKMQHRAAAHNSG